MRKTGSIKHVSISLSTNSVRQTAEFYRYGLLFTLRKESLQRCTVTKDVLTLSFRQTDAVLTPVKEGDTGVLIDLYVENIQKYFKEVQDMRRVAFEQELELMMPRVWQFSLRDNNGYRLFFIRARILVLTSSIPMFETTAQQVKEFFTERIPSRAFANCPFF